MDVQRILFIDAYDSFSNNIISLLETIIPCSVRRVRIDDPILLSSDIALFEELSHYAAVVCGPGPGHPAAAKDVGIFEKIWRLGDHDLLPVLGICLGFQSLCLNFGAKVTRLRGPQHGIIRKISHIGRSGSLGKGTIFDGVGEFRATHYQSLHVDVGQGLDTEPWEDRKWEAPQVCPALLPLAYVEADASTAVGFGVKDDRVLVAVQHSSKPFWALQYHPESVCTDKESHMVIKNWFTKARAWNESHHRRVNLSPPLYGASTIRKSLLSYAQASLLNIHKDICYSRTIEYPEHITIPELTEMMDASARSQILLESTNSNETMSGTTDVRGRFSIIALEVNSAPRFEYSVGSPFVSVTEEGTMRRIELNSGGIWSFLAQYLEVRKVEIGNADSPFWGGFMGFSTYELGLESINISQNESRTRPDLCLAWIRRSLVVDHRKKLIHIQEVATQKSRGTVEKWMDSVTRRVASMTMLLESRPVSPVDSNYSDSQRLHITPMSTPPCSATSSSTNLALQGSSKSDVFDIIKPKDAEYEAKVEQCQDYIARGDSYELCLTDQTVVRRRKPTSISSSWELYQTLRRRQPAPFASYIRMGGATLVSSSPERFLSWDHHNHCSLRPMKGTVRKGSGVDTLEKATELLNVPKEKAENLMIVDLVRHDLHGICGSGNVQVPKLCVVEEYKSVYQMISVVEGQISENLIGDERNKHTGFDVLAASLPPGSMTGAPKIRSCEILQQVEKRDRSLYSGVVGYYDVRGRGDWSVTIRSMFKWDDEDSREEAGYGGSETWYIGAGGAVTTLSSAVGEREEMQTKLYSTLGIFQ